MENSSASTAAISVMATQPLITTAAPLPPTEVMSLKMLSASATGTNLSIGGNANNNLD